MIIVMYETVLETGKIYQPVSKIGKRDLCDAVSATIRLVEGTIVIFFLKYRPLGRGYHSYCLDSSSWPWMSRAISQNSSNTFLSQKTHLLLAWRVLHLHLECQEYSRRQYFVNPLYLHIHIHILSRHHVFLPNSFSWGLSRMLMMLYRYRNSENIWQIAKEKTMKRYQLRSGSPRAHHR